MVQTSKQNSRPDTEPDRRNDRLIPKSEVQVLLGNRSHMHIKRLLANTEANFPRPRYQGRHPFWWRGDVVRWIERLATKPSPQSIEQARRRRTARAEVGHG
jgi:hypothetical protein